MQYRVQLINPAGNFWTFHTPRDRYPNLPKRTLFENQLVSGIDSMLVEIKADHSNFEVIISDEPIKTIYWLQKLMTWHHGDRFDPMKGGNWYTDETGRTGWLCSVLFDYFCPCPELLYVYIVPPILKKPKRTIKQRWNEFAAKRFYKMGGYLEPISEEEYEQANEKKN